MASMRLASGGLRVLKHISCGSRAVVSKQKCFDAVSCRSFSSILSARSHILTSALFRPSVSAQAAVLNRLLHTSGDKELVDFLKDEIKNEKESSVGGGKLPKLKGFDLTTSEGPNVTLTKKSDNETIVIKLNVNNSVDQSLSAEEGDQEDKAAPMVSKPAFIVEISKGGGKTLAIQCVFPPEEDLEVSGEKGAEDGDHYEDVIEIQDVAMLDNGQEWTDDVYSLSGSLMDGNLYDMLLKLLEERGVDGELIQQLIDFSTSYEHKKYVSLLEQLQQFASAK